MKANIDLLKKAEELLIPRAAEHAPEGSLPEAVADQWLHALATDSQFYCDRSKSDPEELSSSVKKLLTDEGLFSGREQFFSQVFGQLKLRPDVNPKFRFIDLFAGIGGIRLGFQKHGGACVFSSEYDRSAQQTYGMNYGEIPFGDITKISEKNIPDHDVLLAGFPCQPFSHAGVSARIAVGMSHGFLCKVQGTLFFDVMRIVEKKRPKILFLENVRNLERHNSGKTFKVIKETVEKSGYKFSYKIVDSSCLVPQRRLRCYMVCVRNDLKSEFEFPLIEGSPLPLKSILEGRVDDKYTISDRLWLGHQLRTKRNLERGTGFTANTADLDKPSNTIVARYGKDGKECLVPQVNKNPRLLTPRECARLQGFPEDFKIPEARTPAYKQFGNSVVVPVISLLAKKITEDFL